jgi:hypothetical protein
MHRHTVFAVLAAPIVAAGILAPPPAARAATVIEEWAGVRLPPPPVLKPVTLVGKETAILAMDFTTQTCTPQRRLRCANQAPQVAKLLSEARLKGAFIVYSVALPGSTAADIL